MNEKAKAPQQTSADRSAHRLRHAGSGKESSGRQVNLAGHAYEHTKRAIIECDLAPGAVVSQSDLQELLGLGKAPIRSALARLEQEGLVRALPRQGYMVSPVTIRDIEEIYGLRMLIEPSATRMAAGKLTDQVIDRLETLARVDFIRGDRKSERAFLRANSDFHVTIALASGNRRLAAWMAQLLEEAMRMTFITLAIVDDTRDWRKGHEAILEALIRGDGGQAEEISRSELIHAREALLRAVISNPVLASINLASTPRSAPAQRALPPGRGRGKRLNG